MGPVDHTDGRLTIACTASDELMPSIRGYAHQAGWIILPGHLPDVVALAGEGRIDGAIVHVQGPGAAEVVAEVAVPMVNTSGGIRRSPMPRVTFDNHAAGRLAVTAVDRPVQHVAFFGLVSEMPNRHYSAERCHGAAEAAAERQASFSASDIAMECDWIDMPHLLGVLRDLPRSTLLVAANDQLAFAIATAAPPNAIGRHWALVGFDNRTTIVESARPTISSIAWDHDSVGQLAATTLAAMLEGRPVAPEQRVAPRRFVARQSTASWGCTHPVVEQALRIIRDRATDGLDIPDLCEALDCSRRTLERHFRQDIHTSPARVIEIHRLEAAQEELLTSDADLTTVAIACGFSSASQLCHRFREHYHTSPGAWRKRQANA